MTSNYAFKTLIVLGDQSESIPPVSKLFKEQILGKTLTAKRKCPKR